MTSVGEMLTQCASRLALFERARVARLGCVTALAGAAGSGLAMWLGIKTPGGVMAGLRFAILCALGLVLLNFVVVALLETLVERSVRRRLEEFIAAGGSEMATLLAAAEVRRGHLSGGTRLVALLKQMQSGP